MRPCPRRDFNVLDADPAYRAASAELDTIGRRNPRGIEDGTPDGKRAAELLAIMRERQRALSN